MRKIDCPLGGWIGLPDEWLGAHARRRDEALAAAQKAKQPPTLQSWSISLALLDDWGELPGMDGRPENWDLDAKSWPLMNWIAEQVLGDMTRALRIPKAPSAWSSGGLKTTQAEQAKKDIDLQAVPST